MPSQLSSVPKRKWTPVRSRLTFATLQEEVTRDVWSPWIGGEVKTEVAVAYQEVRKKGELNGGTVTRRRWAEGGDSGWRCILFVEEWEEELWTYFIEIYKYLFIYLLGGGNVTGGMGVIRFFCFSHRHIWRKSAARFFHLGDFLPAEFKWVHIPGLTHR